MRYVLFLRKTNRRLYNCEPYNTRLCGREPYNTRQEAEDAAVRIINLLNASGFYINPYYRTFLTLEDIKIVIE